MAEHEHATGYVAPAWPWPQSGSPAAAPVGHPAQPPSPHPYASAADGFRPAASGTAPAGAQHAVPSGRSAQDNAPYRATARVRPGGTSYAPADARPHRPRHGRPDPDPVGYPAPDTTSSTSSAPVSAPGAVAATSVTGTTSATPSARATGTNGGTATQQPLRVEPGSWSRRGGGQWVPRPPAADVTDYNIRRYEDSGEVPRGVGYPQAVLDAVPTTERAGPGEPYGPSAHRDTTRTSPGSTRYRHVPSSAHDVPADPAEARTTWSAADLHGSLRDGTSGQVPAGAAGTSAAARASRRTTRTDERPGGFIAAAIATTCWYVLPSLLYLLWTLFLDTEVPRTCIEPEGLTCLSPQRQAMHVLLDHLPQLGVALALSLAVTLMLRWITAGWRAAAVGFAGSVIGAGLATVLFTVLLS